MTLDHDKPRHDLLFVFEYLGRIMTIMTHSQKIIRMCIYLRFLIISWEFVMMIILGELSYRNHSLLLTMILPKRIVMIDDANSKTEHFLAGNGTLSSSSSQPREARRRRSSSPTPKTAPFLARNGGFHPQPVGGWQGRDWALSLGAETKHSVSC